jgi:[ribosomal protein S18]-alanine N-acetyltransferase
MASLPRPPSPLAHVVWRPLALDDLGYVAVLEGEIHAAPWSLGNFRDALLAGYQTLVAESNHRIVAFGVMMLAPGEAQILNVSVVPDHRRLGFGRAVVERFLDAAQARGAEQCFLEVRASNAPAIALYASEGFVTVGRRDGYYPATATKAREDALVMRRALAPSSQPFLARVRSDR